MIVSGNRQAVALE